MREIPNADRCVDWEICGLPKLGHTQCCLLHSPVRKGNGDLNSEFHKQFIAMLEKGHTNFQKVHFQHGTVIQDLECSEVLDLTDTDFEEHGALSFRGVTLKKGLKLNSKTLGAIIFGQDCTLEGPVTINVESTKATQVTIGNKTNFYHDLTIWHSSSIEKFVILNYAVFEGKLRIDARYLGIFQGGRATFSSVLDIQNCTINSGLDLSNVEFSPKSEVNLNGSTLQPNGGLTIGDSSVPRILHINGLKVDGSVVLASPSLSPPMKILAATHPPEISWRQEVRIKNCDLSECCLRGNNLENFIHHNVRWLRWNRFEKLSKCGRDILKDEVGLRKKHFKDKDAVNFMEGAYQILKEQYQQKGNQLQAGYFHYGEMEMRRHGSGLRRRFFSLEFLYWLLSGYGMGWGRAAGLLLLGTLAAWLIYWNQGPCNVEQDWSYWLRHSIKVGTFQRPELLSDSEWSQWTQVIQTIWSPVQIGLLGLAIRMRVRR